jgi:hypothetical protein
MACVGGAVRSIASEASVVISAAQISFGWKHEYPAASFGYTTNRTKKTYQRMLQSLGSRKARGNRVVLSNTDGHMPF